MEGTRKNRRSEYKNVGKWGFVPKLGVTLLAALIALSLAGCKNAAGGGVGSSGSGDASSAGAGNRMVHTFYDGETQVGKFTTYESKSFSEIKSNITQIPAIEGDADFIGWEIKGTGNLVVSDEQKFSENATFVASYQKTSSGYKTPEQLDFVGSKDADGSYAATYGWYNQATQEYLFFKDNGYAYVIKAGLLKANALVADYAKYEEAKQLAAKNYNASKPETKEAKAKADKDFYDYENMLKKDYGFCELIFFGNNWDWTSETEKACVYDAGWNPKYEFYLSQKGNALIYASGPDAGKVAFIRDEIQI